MTQTTLSKTGQSFDQDGYIAIQPLFDAAKMQEINRELDRFIVELGALLHDIADSKFHNGDETIGPILARKFLENELVADH